MTVTLQHPGGYVYGSEFGDCGGGAAVYGPKGGQWGVLVVMQAMPTCQELADAGVPAGLGIMCGDGSSQRDY